MVYHILHITAFLAIALQYLHVGSIAAELRTDYTLLEDAQGYYKVHKDLSTWQDAKKICTSEGAKFFYPENECETNVVLKFLNETSPYYWIYIGVSSPVVGLFETLDGRLIDEVYNKWGPGEPNNADGVEGCAILRQDGTINDDHCDKKYPFICKIPVDTPREDAACERRNTLRTIGQPSEHFFRKDYTCLADTESFYKIHTIHGNWQYAKKKCAAEGASLFYPETLEEANSVIHFWNQTQPFYWVYVGISSLLAKGVFETIDGRPVADVYSNWGPGEPNDANGKEDCVILRRDGTLNDDNCAAKYPFICKKTLASLQWNILCDIPDMSYTYSEAQGKCYKFHLNPMNWTDAYATCGAEQSYLAVINSQDEANYLIKITEDAPKEKVRSPHLSGAVYLGYRNFPEEGWRTVKGQSLEDSGYDKWGNQQPDGGERETCGSMFYNGELNDITCDPKCFFICEHDIGSLSSSLDERFGN